MNTIADYSRLVITFSEIGSIVVPLLYLALVTAVEHMAFRQPHWQRRELVRRAIGIVTVLGFTLLPVSTGQADLRTWVIIAAGFAVAGAVKVAAAAYEREKSAERTGSFHEQFKRIVGEEPDASSDSRQPPNVF